MSVPSDPLDPSRVVDELEQKIGPAVEDMPTPPTSEGSVGAVPDQTEAVPGTPEPPD